MRWDQRIRTGLGCGALLIFGLSGTPVAAAGLSEIWQAVSEHSPQAASALFAKEAGQHRLEQAQALWRPQVNLGAGAGKMNAASDLSGAHFMAPGFGAANGVDFNTSVQQGHASNWVLEIQQPLLNAQLSAQSAQLKTSGTVADLQYALAKNTLLLGTVQQYFQWLMQNEQLNVLNRHLAVVVNLQAQAQERFRLGDTPVTDMLDAEAQEKTLRAQKSGLLNQIQNTQKVLEDATGWSASQWSRVEKQLARLEMAKPLDLSTYQDQASIQNLGLRLLDAKLELARQTSKSHTLESSPSLALVARATQQRLEGGGDFGSSASSNKQQYLGLQLNVPLYSGGMRSAQLAESLSQVEQLRMDLDAARLAVDQGIQAQWLSWQSNPDDLVAAQALVLANQKRLEATRLAYQVGDRSLQDVLHAQADSASAELSLFNLRLSGLWEQLSLYGLLGPIEESQLQMLDAQFGVDQPSVLN
jgi:outer membrane protein